MAMVEDMEVQNSNAPARGYAARRRWWITIAAFIAAYLLGSSWAVARPERAPWAWPLAVILAFGCGLLVLTVVEGGTHHCST